MSCQRPEELIHGYLDGELDVARSLEVEQHMRECEVSARAFRNQTTLRSYLKGESLYYGAPEKLKKRIQSSLRKEAKSEVFPRAFSWRWLTVGASLAFMLLIGLVIWRVAPRVIRPSSEELLAQEIVSDHIRSLQLDNHRIDVISEDPHTVKPWFDGKLDFAPPVKDLSGQGFPLLGGRLEYLNNQTVAALVYSRRNHFINLFIWPSEHAGATGEITTQHKGYDLIHWTSSGMNYWAVSDLNSVELHEFAQLVQQGQ